MKLSIIVLLATLGACSEPRIAHQPPEATVVDAQEQQAAARVLTACKIVNLDDSAVFMFATTDMDQLVADAATVVTIDSLPASPNLQAVKVFASSILISMVDLKQGNVDIASVLSALEGAAANCSA